MREIKLHSANIAPDAEVNATGQHHDRHPQCDEQILSQYTSQIIQVPWRVEVGLVNTLGGIAATIAMMKMKDHMSGE